MNFRRDFQVRSAGFQIAPMVDLMFQILLFFMVSSVYSQWETSLDISIPTATQGTQQVRTEGELIINIDAKGRIFVSSLELSPARLESVLAQVARTYQGQAVIVRTDRKTAFEDVIRVLDICRKVDIWNVSFATLPAEP